MRVTIGEVVNELLPYSRDMRISMAGDFPFLEAEIGTNSRYTKGHLYIVQVSENKYSICDCRDNLHGNGYIPTQNLENPFVKEKQIIADMYVYKNSDDEPDSITLNLEYPKFITHLHKLLFQYGVVRIDPKIFTKKISDHDTIPLTPRVLNGLESIFKEYKILDPKIKDLINIVKTKLTKFNIQPIKGKDVKDMQNKFQHIGINLIIEKNIITDITFAKIK